MKPETLALAKGLLPTSSPSDVVSKPLVDTGHHRQYDTGARRDSNIGKGRFDLINSHFLLRLAIHLEKGAGKYAERNWEKGIPLKRTFDSLIRHSYQWLEGNTDEDHLAAIACNIMFLIATEKNIKEGKLPHALLDDLPPERIAAILGIQNLPKDT